MAHPGPMTDSRSLRGEALKKGTDAAKFPIDTPPEQGMPKGAVKGKYNDVAAPPSGKPVEI